MPFVFNYVAPGKRVGRCIIAGNSDEEALLRAKRALRGLDCLGAVLRFADSFDACLEGRVIASYTPGLGWSAVANGEAGLSSGMEC